MHATRRLVFLCIVGIIVTGSSQTTAAQTGQNNGVPNRITALEQRMLALEQLAADQDRQLALSRPLDVTVDCAAGQTIGAALAQAGQRAAWVTITVLGVCRESVAIQRSQTVIRGGAPGAGIESPSSSMKTLLVEKAHDVVLTSLSLTGGSGVQFSGHASVRANTLRIAGSSFHGLTIIGATADVNNSLITGSAIEGVQATSGSHVRLTATVVEDNAFAVDVSNGSFALLDLGSRIANNGSGAAVTFGSMLHVGSATIEHNAGPGVMVLGGSAVHFGFGGRLARIRSNHGHGLQLLDTSVASALFEGGAAEITQNDFFGVFCSGSPAVAQIVGTIGPVTGNLAGEINCPVSQ